MGSSSVGSESHTPLHTSTTKEVEATAPPYPSQRQRQRGHPPCWKKQVDTPHPAGVDPTTFGSIHPLPVRGWTQIPPHIQGVARLVEPCGPMMPEWIWRPKKRMERRSRGWLDSKANWSVEAMGNRQPRLPAFNQPPRQPLRSLGGRNGHQEGDGRVAKRSTMWKESQASRPSTSGTETTYSLGHDWVPCPGIPNQRFSHDELPLVAGDGTSFAPRRCPPSTES